MSVITPGAERGWSETAHPAPFTVLLILLSAVLVSRVGGADGEGQRESHSSMDCRPVQQGGAASPTSPQPILDVVIKPILNSKHGAENEITDKKQQYDTYGYISAAATLPPCHNPGPEVSVTTTDSDTWKTKVIIGCTVAAAIEIIIIIVIIAYWREIRWTMRKIACPCDERPSRHGDHEAMERAEVDVVRVASVGRHGGVMMGSTERYMEELEERGVLLEHVLDDAPSQTFTHPNRSRTQEALDDMHTEDTTTPV